MKKITLLLLIFTIPIISFSQEFGNYKVENAIIYNNNTAFNNNKWYSDNEGKFSFIRYNQTPIGIKKALETVRSILYLNNIKFENAFIDSSFLSAVVTNIDDYELLNITIKDESSEVSKQWRLPTYTYLLLRLKIDKYEVSLLKL